MTVIRRITGFVVAASAVFGMAWLSQAPVPGGGTASGQLRLAWRARPERIDVCREQSAETLRALPAHMRQTVICEGRNASYRLEVTRDADTIVDTVVRPGGLRGDRPIYVFREIDLHSGDAQVTVKLTRIDSSGNGEEGQSVRHSALADALPASVVFTERLHFAPGQVRVISYDPDRRELFEVRP